MRALFLQDNGINESLLLCELSAVLRAAGHRTAVLLEREERDLRAAVEAWSPDLILLPTSIRGHAWVLSTCRRLERWLPDVPRVLAGSHPTFFPDILDFDEVPMIIVGEAEHATLELLDALAGRRPLRNIANLHLKVGKTVHRNGVRPLVEDLDALPLPDRDLYFGRYRFMAAFPWKKFSSGRGCYHHCSYCYQPHYRELVSGRGNYVRRKSPGRVAAEVAAVGAAHPLSNVHFADDLFITSVDWLREFSERHDAAGGAPYTINSSAELITETTAGLLARSGCRAVAIGLETHDQGLRQDILRKRLDNHTIRRAARLIRDHGMTLVTFNMLAAPGEAIRGALETLRFNVDIGAHHARVGICFPIPGTDMARRALAAGQCLEGFGEDIYRRPDTEDSRPRVYFSSARRDEHRFINLFHLFSLGVAHPRLIPLIERLIDLPQNPLLALGGLHGLLQEKALYRFSLLQGVRYFSHVGWPSRRTSNFVSLV